MKASKPVFDRRRAESGQIMLMVGMMAIVMAAFIGISVDVGRLYAEKTRLSRAVDAAALAGVMEFNGTPTGLTNAATKATAYFTANEPTANAPTVTPDGGTNKLTVDGTKSVPLYFINFLPGVPNSITVKAHAVAGFGTQTIDAVMVIDSTSSMGDSPCDAEQDNSGCPIWEAKNAAKSFKNVLLGTSPNGNVVVGVAPFRGCYRATTQVATAPMASTKTNCPSENSQVTYLSSATATLDTRIDAITSVGGSGTNVCGGLLKGWEILEGAGNHTATQNNRRFMVVLSDGDNRYTGSYTYQSSPFASPHTYQTKPCQPPSSCSNVGGATSSPPCHDGVAVAAFTISDNMNTSGWTGGSGWIASSWTTAGTVSKTTSSSPQGTYHAQLGRAASVPSSYGSITRTFSLSSGTASLSYYVKRNSNVGSSDRLVVDMVCGSSTYTLKTYSSASSSGVTAVGTSYPGSPYSVALDSCAGQSTVTLRFRVTAMSSTSGLFFVDTVSISGGQSDFDGYLNGDDLSNNCGSAVPRERQLDLETYDASKSIKADGIEIFVVAFGVCSSNSTTFTTAQCDSLVGNTDTDSTADQRLLKCISSSSTNTLDHYYYASNATSLPTIFTSIAQQIAQRLVE